MALLTPDRDKSHLFGPFANLITGFEAQLQQANLPFYLFEGVRTHERQAELYAQGRTAPGPVVTKAQPGQSWHQYGLACDFVLDGMEEKPGVQWSWKPDPRWRRMAELARNCGLDAAYFWPVFQESPHVEKRYGLSLARAQKLYARGGLPEVWAEAMDWIEQMTWP